MKAKIKTYKIHRQAEFVRTLLNNFGNLDARVVNFTGGLGGPWVVEAGFTGEYLMTDGTFQVV